MFPNLLTEMERRGITASKLAKAMGKPKHSAVSKLEGTVEFSMSDIVAIRDALFPELSLDYLFERKAAAESVA